MNPSTLPSPKKMSVSNVLNEAWSLVSGLKMPIFLRLLAMLAIIVVVPGLTLLAFFSAGMLHTPAIVGALVLVGMVYACIAFFALCLIGASCVLLGVRQAAGLPIDVKRVNADVWQHKGGIFGLAMIAIGIAVAIKIISYFLLLLHVPHFIASIVAFLVTSYLTLPIKVFALPLLLTQHSSVGNALHSGYGMMKRYWLPLLSCYILMILVVAISEFLIILWIWTVPMFYAVYGIFFRDAYGLQNTRDTQTHTMLPENNTPPPRP